MVFLKPEFLFYWTLCLSFCLSGYRMHAAPGDENWDSGFNQPILGPGSISSMAVIGNDLYVAGSFSQAGGVRTTNLAKWDGTNWSAWGQDLPGWTRSVTAVGTNLYVFGWFNLSNGLSSTTVRWNGQGWASVADDMQVGSVVPYKNGICVTGAANDPEAGYGAQILEVTETNRTVLGFWTNAAVRTIASLGNQIIVDLDYYYWSEQGVTNLVRWDGTKWYGIDGASSDTFNNAVRLYGDDRWIYAAGVFTNIAGIAATHLARWDGTNWQAFSNGLEFGTNGGIASLAFGGGKLYVSGIFGSIQQSNDWNIAEWNGTQWTILPGSPRSRTVLAVGQDGLFAAGDFARLNGRAVNGIARWDGIQWQSLSSGVVGVGFVNSLAVQGSNVFVGGKFHTIGGIAATNLARWNGSQWFPVGQGTEKPVDVLYATDQALYAGGQFRTIDGIQVSGLGSFDGTNWKALGSNNTFVPTHFGSFGTNLFVSGSFPVPELWHVVNDSETTFVFQGDEAVFRWAGGDWEASLTNVTVSGFGGTASRFFVATTRGAAVYGPTSYLWEWTGNNFSQVSGMTNFLSSIVTVGDLVYFMGQRYDWRIVPPPLPGLPPSRPPIPPPPTNSFITSVQKSLPVYGIPRPSGVTTWLGRLDGTNWWQTDIPADFYPPHAVALGEDLYAADYLGPLRWDGVEWERLGSGIIGQINTFAAWGTNVVVGGKFNFAGGKVSNGFAVWHQPPAPLKLRITGDPNSTNKVPAKPMVVSWPKAFSNLVAEESPDLMNGPWTRVKQSQFVFGSHTVITSPPPAMTITNRFFRLRNAP